MKKVKFRVPRVRLPPGTYDVSVDGKTIPVGVATVPGDSKELGIDLEEYKHQAVYVAHTGTHQTVPIDETEMTVEVNESGVPRDAGLPYVNQILRVCRFEDDDPNIEILGPMDFGPGWSDTLSDLWDYGIRISGYTPTESTTTTIPQTNHQTEMNLNWNLISLPVTL